MDRITTVIATSPIPTMPAIGHISTTITSLNLVPELAESPIIIVFDAPNHGRIEKMYDEYKQNVGDYCRERPNIRLFYLQEWGHLSGVMEAAVANVRTPYMFVQQHDLPIIRAFDLEGVLRCLSKDEAVKHVRLNRRYNTAIGWDKSSLFGPYKNPYVPLTRTACWSDQSHITTVAYYREIVLPEIRGKRVFMEDVLNAKRQMSSEQELQAVHRRLGTYILGEPGAPPVIRHTDARNDSREWKPSFY